MTPPRVLDISIVVPTYNRGAVVERNFLRWTALAPRAKEIVLADDGSDEASAEILRALTRRHEDVRHVRLAENGGQAVARSVGFAAASGKYIVSLDDDSWLLEPDALQRVWDRMEALPRCAILAFNLFSPGIPITPPEDRLLAVADHLTCGAAYRADVLARIGYHLGFLRYVGEETDLSLKARAAGYEVVQDLGIRGFHDYDPTARSTQSLVQVRAFGVRNDLARTVVFFPWPLVPALLVWQALSHLRFGLAHGLARATLRGCAGFPAVLPAALRARRPVPWKAACRYLKLRRAPEPYTP